jgi:antitoxin FitA
MSGALGPAEEGTDALCSEEQYIACMASITVRDVPDEARDELAARAARTGRSLQEYLRLALIDLARRPDPDDLLRRVAERKQRTGSALSAEQILGHRDADRR